MTSGRARGERALRAPLIVHVTTIPMTLRFLRGQTRHMRRHGFRVAYVASPDPVFATIAEEEGVDFLEVAMERRITPVRDIVAVSRLVEVFRRLRPAIVHAHTPKAGLLGMLAATICRVPVRIYHLHGVPALSARGYRKFLLTNADRVACCLAVRLFSVSVSVRNLAGGARLCSPGSLVIHESGTINGIDAERFSVEAVAGELPALRERLGIPDGVVVVGFVGRWVRDKGVLDLLEAWKHVRARGLNACLLFLGGPESHDPLPSSALDAIRDSSSIRAVDFVMEPAPYYGLMDLLVLPSYREGFPYAPMEAAAMGRPAVVSEVCGCTDAVVDGETGLLVPPGNPTELARAIARYIEDEPLRLRHGQAARERVLRSFVPLDIWKAQHAQYVSLLREKGIDCSAEDLIPRER